MKLKTVVSASGAPALVGKTKTNMSVVFQAWGIGSVGHIPLAGTPAGSSGDAKDTAQGRAPF